MRTSEIVCCVNIGGESFKNAGRGTLHNPAPRFQAQGPQILEQHGRGLAVAFDKDRLRSPTAERFDTDGARPRIGIDKDLADKLLSRLSPEDRTLLQIIYVEGLNIAEAAENLGWGVAKTKLRAWRARNALRKYLTRLL